MGVMFFAWMLSRRPNTQSQIQANVTYSEDYPPGSQSRVTKALPRLYDLVDISTVNLYQDEYTESMEGDVDAEDVMRKRIDGKLGILWKIYYFLV